MGTPCAFPPHQPRKKTTNVRKPRQQTTNIEPIESHPEDGISTNDYERSAWEPREESPEKESDQKHKMYRQQPQTRNNAQMACIAENFKVLKGTSNSAALAIGPTQMMYDLHTWIEKNSVGGRFRIV